MIVCFPMYDRPETRSGYDHLWTLIRTQIEPEWQARFAGADLPVRPAHDIAMWDGWQSSDLLLGQTCGLPYRRALHDKVSLICTLDYDLTDCRPGHYNSVFVMRADKAIENPADWTDLTLAANSDCSQSGLAAPLTFMADRDLSFARIIFTGGHRLSARAVIDGTADIAAIDAQTWRMIRRWDSEADALVDVSRTDDTPGLPLISAPGFAPLDLASAVQTAVADLPPDTATALGIRGTVMIPKAAYLAIPTPEVPVK